jgi:hypothetical protein
MDTSARKFELIRTAAKMVSDEQLKGAGLLKAEMMQTVYPENRGK